MSERLSKEEAHPSPEKIVEDVLMESLNLGSLGYAESSSEMRKKAQRITDALRRHGWRIIR